MKSLKRSAIIFTISVAGFLAIRAAETPPAVFTGQSFTLEELAWQSVPSETRSSPASGSDVREIMELLSENPASTTTMRSEGPSKCTFKCTQVSNR